MRTGNFQGGNGWPGGVGSQQPGWGSPHAPGPGAGQRFGPQPSAQPVSGSLLGGLRDLLHPPGRSHAHDPFANATHMADGGTNARGGWQYAGGGRAVWTGPYQGDTLTAQQYKTLERAFAIPATLAVGSFGPLAGIFTYFGMRRDLRQWMDYLSTLGNETKRASSGSPHGSAALPYMPYMPYPMMNMPGIWGPAAMASSMDPWCSGMGGPYGYGMAGMGFPYPMPYPYPYPVPSGPSTARQPSNSQFGNARFAVSPDGRATDSQGKERVRLRDVGDSWDKVFPNRSSKVGVDFQYFILQGKIRQSPGADPRSVAEDLRQLDTFYQQALQHLDRPNAAHTDHNSLRV